MQTVKIRMISCQCLRRESTVRIHAHMPAFTHTYRHTCVHSHINSTPGESVYCSFIVSRICGYPPFRAKEEGTLYDLIREAKVEFDDMAWSLVSEAGECENKPKF